MTAQTDAAPAVIPGRVLVLDEYQQRKLLAAMDFLSRGDDPEATRMRNLLAYGEEYADETDELIRVTLRKRKLEAAVRACNQRIAELDEVVVEMIVERGDTGGKHAATGASYRLDSKIWAKVVKAGEKATDDEKAAAARGLQAAGLGDFVQPGFNTNSVSAFFREQIKAHRAEQAALPEHERRPLPASAFLPPELNGLIELDDTPTVQVRAS